MADKDDPADPLVGKRYTVLQNVVLVSFCAVGGLALFGLMQCATNLPPDDGSFEAIAKAESAIRAQLRDPDSAQFRKELVVRVPAQGSAPAGPLSVCGEVNANNAFGGKTGYSRFLWNDDHRYTGDVLIENSPGAGAFALFWPKACDAAQG